MQATAPPASVPAVVKTTEARYQPAAFATRAGETVTTGATVSTVQDAEAGDGSRRPSSATARTSSVCAPSLSRVSVVGLKHTVNTAPSRAHWKVADGSSEENATNALFEATNPAGAVVIVVFGGASAEIVQEKLAGVASRLPAVST